MCCGRPLIPESTEHTLASSCHLVAPGHGQALVCHPQQAGLCPYSKGRQQRASRIWATGLECGPCTVAGIPCLAMPAISWQAAVTLLPQAMARPWSATPSWRGFTLPIEDAAAASVQDIGHRLGVRISCCGRPLKPAEIAEHTLKSRCHLVAPGHGQALVCHPQQAGLAVRIEGAAEAGVQDVGHGHLAQGGQVGNARAAGTVQGGQLSHHRGHVASLHNACRGNHKLAEAEGLKMEQKGGAAGPPWSSRRQPARPMRFYDSAGWLTMSHACSQGSTCSRHMLVGLATL